jgi:hypothetical protein
MFISFFPTRRWKKLSSTVTFNESMSNYIHRTEVLHKFHSGQVFALLVCYAVYVGSCLLKFKERFLFPSLRSQQSWPLKMGTKGCPKMLVNNYQHTPCNSSEEWRPHLQCGSNLKSWKFYPFSTSPLRDKELNNELWLINFLDSVTCHNFGL